MDLIILLKHGSKAMIVRVIQTSLEETKISENTLLCDLDTDINTILSNCKF